MHYGVPLHDDFGLPDCPDYDLRGPWVVFAFLVLFCVRHVRWLWHIGSLSWYYLASASMTSVGLGDGYIIIHHTLQTLRAGRKRPHSNGAMAALCDGISSLCAPSPIPRGDKKWPWRTLKRGELGLRHLRLPSVLLHTKWAASEPAIVYPCGLTRCLGIRRTMIRSGPRYPWVSVDAAGALL